MPSGLVSFLQTFFDLHQMAAALPVLLAVGFKNTLVLSVASLLLSTLLGLPLALLLLSTRWWIRFPARTYIEVFRGLPGIVSIYLVGQGLPIAGIRVLGTSSYPYAILALTLVNGAYIAEILRSGIQSVDKGQMEAARSLGLPYWKAMALVIVPQGVRRILPAMTNQFIIIVKESALVYLLGLLPGQRELFSIAQDFTVQYANMSPLVVAGLCYLLITVPLTYVVNALDHRLRNGGRIRRDQLGDQQAPSLTVGAEG